MRSFSLSRRVLATSAAVAALALPLAACSGDGDGGNDEAPRSEAAASAPAVPATGGVTPAGTAPFGAACAKIPSTGSGSLTGMAQDPVATAASNNPLLSTLVGAVGQAGLVDTLNTAKDITVFAPTNEAFAKIPKDTLAKVLADKEQLTRVLTYHVVGKRLTPGQLGGGSFETLAKDTLTTAGSGEAFTVNGNSKVICGNVPTANATVYLVDTVLMPPAS